MASSTTAFPRVLVRALGAEETAKLAEERALRLEVLLKPVGVDAWWHKDADSVHFVAFEAAADGVSEGPMTGCVLLYLPEQRLHQMAVAVSAQGRGIGRLVVDALEAHVAAEGGGRVVLAARHYAVGFYARCGYLSEGSEYTMVGIPHFTMVKSIRAAVGAHVVRAAAGGDVAAVVEVVNDAFREGEGPYFAAADYSRTSAEEISSLIAGPDSAVIVAAHARTGVVEASISVWATSAMNASHAYLGMLSVIAGRRGSGLARRLVDAAESWAVARGLPAIDLKIINLRRELLSVYPRWGFTITGARAWPDRARFVRPEFVDAFNFTTMTKRLGSAPAGMLPPPGPLMDGRSRGAGCEERPVLVVRVACPSDTAAIVSLVNDAFRAEAWVFAAGDEYRRTCEAEVAAYVAAGEMLVAAVAGDVEEGSAACALFSHVSPMTPLTSCKTSYFGMLSVARRWRGRGVGRAMVKHIESLAGASGARAIEIRIINVRTDMASLYPRWGYYVTGTWPWQESRPALSTEAKDAILIRLLKPLAAPVPSPAASTVDGHVMDA